MLGIGLTPYEILLSIFARAADHNGGRQFPNHYSSKTAGLMSFSSILAAHCPHAVGAAYALKYRGETRPRGARARPATARPSEGEWHESMNFAAVHKLPFVMLVENNEWAISTPLAKQMAHRRRFGKRAAATACRAPSSTASIRSRPTPPSRRRWTARASGGGPSLVEGTCYRFLAHSTDDNDMTYRTREEVDERRKHDPVPRFEALLIEARHHRRAPTSKAMRKDVLRETNEATDAAEALPYPQPSDLYTHVYEGAWQPWQS